ncbi:MAG TPA: hypothetical protein VN823_15900 [Stellaceae bacterium]|nr:hypothetical protein [Stellaceae bacterium]
MSRAIRLLPAAVAALIVAALSAHSQTLPPIVSPLTESNAESFPQLAPEPPLSQFAIPTKIAPGTQFRQKAFDKLASNTAIYQRQENIVFAAPVKAHRTTMLPPIRKR